MQVVVLKNQVIEDKKHPFSQMEVITLKVVQISLCILCHTDNYLKNSEIKGTRSMERSCVNLVQKNKFMPVTTLWNKIKYQVVPLNLLINSAIANWHKMHNSFLIKPFKLCTNEIGSRCRSQLFSIIYG